MALWNADRRRRPPTFEEEAMTRRFLTTLALLALTATAARAQATAKVPVAPDSKIWIDGTSNLHDWSCKATSLEANVELDAVAAAQFANAAPKALKKVDVKIPVKSLHCNHGGMDGNVYKALKADAAPEISYIMATFEAVAGEAKDTFTLKTVGTLTIAGKQNKIDMDVVATRLADGTVIAKGVVPIKMTDYGITPPTAIFGRLKTGDEVKVNFELSVGAKAIAAALNDK
jgi:polyisoprenoid-binding protein YceI